MARCRNLKPGFFKNEQLAECSPLARILFQGLWCFADREGRLENRPKRLKAEILPYDDCRIPALLAELTERGFIIQYEVEGNALIQVANFAKHQNPHVKEQASTLPAPDMPGATMGPTPDKNEAKPGKPSARPELAGPLTSLLNPSSLQPLPGSPGAKPGEPGVVASSDESHGVRLKAQACVGYIRAFDDAIAKHWGESQRRPWPHSKDVWQAGQWLDAGIPIAVVEIVADQHFAKLKAEGEKIPPTTLKYLDVMVRRAEQERKKPRVNGKRETVLHVERTIPNDSPDLDPRIWRIRLERWTKNREWMSSYGPSPEYATCHAPDSILAEFNINHEPRAAS